MLVIRGAYIRGGLIFGEGLHSGFYGMSMENINDLDNKKIYAELVSNLRQL